MIGVSLTRPALAALAAPLLVACAGPLSGGTPDISPNPLTVAVTLDTPRTVTQLVPEGGGTVTATAEDGTVYTLTIPAGTLVTETEITMTPILSVEGAPVKGGAPLGVDLAPDGLRLYQAATLAVAPPGGVEGAEFLSFSYHAGGEEFHGYPAAQETGALTFELLHFSGYVAHIGADLEATLRPEQFMPTDWESRLEHQVQDLMHREQAAQRNGEPGDLQFSEKLEDLFRSYYQRVIAPILPAVASDCQAAEAHAAKLLAFVRQLELLGLAGEFAAESAAIWDSIIAGLKACWDETVEPCLDPSDAEQFRRAVSLSRQLQLLGESSDQYDPFDPAVQCQTDYAWSGTITFTESGSITRHSDDPETTGSWTNTYDHQQTIEVIGMDSVLANGGAHLKVTVSAQATQTEDGHYRTEHYDDCRASEPPILRYVIETSSQYTLTATETGLEAIATVVVNEDGTYRVVAGVEGLLTSGTSTRHDYYVDNCWPDSEQDETTTEPLELLIDADTIDVGGQVSPDDPDRFQGSYITHREQDQGELTTVTITWDLVRSPQ